MHPHVWKVGVETSSSPFAVLEKITQALGVDLRYLNASNEKHTLIY
jgi:hypothetical protein